MLMGEAAGRGSKVACCNLGRAYADGLWGFPKDETMARRYYSMVESASLDDCSKCCVRTQRELAPDARDNKLPKAPSSQLAKIPDDVPRILFEQSFQ